MPSLNTASETAPPPGTPPSAAAIPAAPSATPTYEGKDEAEKLTRALADYYARNGAAASIITSLDGLVKAGLIKSVPVPPAGKKYIVDVKQCEVRLVNQ